MKSRDEIKSNLRDWMTSTCQLTKAKFNNVTVSDITFMWRSQFGIKMTDAWVKKALYGKKR